MGKTITSLTAAQQALFPEYVRKWIAIGLSAKPANREASERAIAGLYKLAKLKEPRVIWLPCPISGALAALVYTQVRGALRSERSEPRPVRSAVYSAVDSAVGSAVYSAVDSAVRSGVRSAVDSAVRSGVRSAVGSAVDSAVRSAVGSAVGSAVDSAVDSAVGSAVGSAVDSAVDSAVGSAVGSAVDSAVRSAVRSAVGSAVGSAVDSAVRSAVGSAVGSAVDSAVGSAVYSAVGSAVGSAVDSADAKYRISDALRNAMNEAGRAFFWAQWAAGYSAWADYFNEVLSISIDRNFLDLTESCGFFWTLDDVCFASERPTKINLDERGRLHSGIEQSIGYSSGWGLWHWHGVQVRREVIERPETITVRDIKDEGNAEVRRVMIDRYGVARYLKDSGARIVHEVPADHPIKGLRTAKLLSVDVPGDESIVMVDLLNSTPEPDGTTKRYQLRVDPNAYAGLASRDCHAAAASTWRNADGSLAFKKHTDYRPAFES
jgi:hypothetical protein